MPAEACQDHDGIGSGEYPKQILWDKPAGCSFAMTLPPAMLVHVSGTCSYEDFIELSHYVSTRWGPPDRYLMPQDQVRRSLIVDFSRLESHDSVGMREFLGHLLRSARDLGRDIHMVRAPLDVREIEKRFRWRGKIRHAVNLEHALRNLARSTSTDEEAGTSRTLRGSS